MKKISIIKQKHPICEDKWIVFIKEQTCTGKEFGEGGCNCLYFNYNDRLFRLLSSDSFMDSHFSAPETFYVISHNNKRIKSMEPPMILDITVLEAFEHGIKLYNKCFSEQKEDESFEGWELVE